MTTHKDSYTPKHWADKVILRDLFWFLVLPYKFRQWADTRSDATHSPTKETP